MKSKTNDDKFKRNLLITGALLTGIIGVGIGKVIGAKKCKDGAAFAISHILKDKNFINYMLNMQKTL